MGILSTEFSYRYVIFVYAIPALSQEQGLPKTNFLQLIM